MGGGGGSGSGGARGNPYQATSAYPPPPRRTQPGTYQRPQAAGADRFSNFPRAAPTAKRPDPAGDRQNAFKAWQNMNTAQDRQQQQARHAQASAQAQAKTASPKRPVPPPRADPKFPSDEKIRAGFNYREAPHSSFADGAEERQSAWAAFQASRNNANSPGVKRSNTNKTPKKQGFDPNAPGSDEGMAPDSQYAHRHKSADFGRPSAAPPPPPRPSRPGSPKTTPQRPQADPLRPFKSRTHTAEEEVDAPYSEGNRVRTPYSSFSGEKTDFGGDMRRSNSTRDAFKLNPGANASRARSTSPLGRSSSGKSTEGPQSNNRPSFSVGGSSSTSSDSSEHEMGAMPEQRRGSSAQSGKTSMPPQNRPKIVPSPPSRRFNGPSNPASPPANGTNEGEMKQKSSSNMYVNPPTPEPQHPPFTLEEWASRMFGTKAVGGTLRRNAVIPKWAIPASLLPQRKSVKHGYGDDARSNMQSPHSKTVHTPSRVASEDEKKAYLCFRRCLELFYDPLPSSLDIDVFLTLASTARTGKLDRLEPLDSILADTLTLYPTVGDKLDKAQLANNNFHSSRFSFPVPPEMFSPTSNAKSRSEESINTKFSPGGWSGTFEGSSEYFAPPQAASRRGSPSLRGGQRPGMRTMNSGFGQSTSEAQSPTTNSMPPPPPPFAAQQGGAFPDPSSAGSDTKFSKDQWEQTFKDSSWFPPPPSMPPSSPVKGGARSRPVSRKNSRAAHTRPTSSSTGTAANPHVVEEEDDTTIDPKSTSSTNQPSGFHEPDAMDIDNTPPATEQSQPQTQHSQAGQSKEPRLVSVPPSAWRQSQQPSASNGHHRTTSGGSSNAPLKANLNDLANVAPFAQTSNGSGLQDLNSMSASLPFTSQAANTLPINPLKPQTLSTPVVPIPPKAPTRLSKQAWHQYAQNFGVYLQAFNSFNGAMLQHFQAREQQVAARMQKGMAWLEATGDPIAGGGFGSYARDVKEDERVREIWNMGCERHADAVKEFDDVRERVRRLAVAGTIAEQ